jgi:hypothetical protein
MRAIIGAKFIASDLAEPGPKPFENYDTRLSGFTLCSRKEMQTPRSAGSPTCLVTGPPPMR